MKKAFSVISNISTSAIDILESNNIDLTIDNSGNIPNTQEIKESDVVHVSSEDIKNFIEERTANVDTSTILSETASQVGENTEINDNQEEQTTPQNQTNQ